MVGHPALEDLAGDAKQKPPSITLWILYSFIGFGIVTTSIIPLIVEVLSQYK